MVLAALAVAAALLAMTAATFAWYVYNTSARTTQVKMVAGSSITLQIASAPEGPYSSSAVMQSFTGTLTPVSTDKIAGGFQKVRGFTSESSGQTNRLVASFFLPGTETVDYYKTSLYFKTNTENLGIYLSNVAFQDASDQDPISTAMRLGIVAQGQEAIFAINTPPPIPTPTTTPPGSLRAAMCWTAPKQTAPPFPSLPIPRTISACTTRRTAPFPCRKTPCGCAPSPATARAATASR